MLVASSLRDSTSENNDNQETIEVINNMDDDFSDFSTGSLLDSIDFDELFAGLDHDDSDHMLPDLEILGDYSIDGTTGDEQGLSSDEGGLDGNDVVSASVSGSGQDTNSICSLNDGVVDKAGEVIDVIEHGGKEVPTAKPKKSATPTANKAGRSKTRCSDGKRKVKVDWTPELHKRFVQAVEQLGEKAVPSRILEVMCTDGLTRHNIASHLQKYRSHRKHLIAREAEAASWNQRRHIGAIEKRVVSSSWLVPTSTMGYPPVSSMPLPPQHVHHSQLIRPLHVWGHPSSGNHVQTASNMWSKHFVPHHLRPPHLQPQQVWTPPPRPLPYGCMPCFPPPSQGFVAAPVSGIIPHHVLYKNTPNSAAGHLPSQLLCSTPSNERIDAALGDVLAKPWLPLPIGLKPPAIDTVVGELQRQGVPQIPPSLLPSIC